MSPMREAIEDSEMHRVLGKAARDKSATDRMQAMAARRERQAAARSQFAQRKAVRRREETMSGWSVFGNEVESDLFTTGNGEQAGVMGLSVPADRANTEHNGTQEHNDKGSATAGRWLTNPNKTRTRRKLRRSICADRLRGK